MLRPTDDTSDFLTQRDELHDSSSVQCIEGSSLLADPDTTGGMAV